MMPRLCKVPSGEFIMGGEASEGFKEECPARKVYLDEFYIDETPVTCDQYEIFIRWMIITNDHSRCHLDEPPQKDHRPIISNLDMYYQPDQPVTGIDWFDMYAFAVWAGMRLPTEAEWEKAARGIDGRKWPWGNQSGLQDGKLQALYDDTGYFVEHPRLAGVYDHPNGVSPYGCLDMAGNVWEVCEDYHDANWYERMPRRNPKNTNKTDKVIMRGGAWNYNEHDAMCAIRVGIIQRFKNTMPIGFRCASDNPNPVGAIGPMRHKKPENEKQPPNEKWMTLVHPDGMEYFDGDNVGPKGLLLAVQELASLNDFYLLYWTPPPLNWMLNFSDIDIRHYLRDATKFQHISLESLMAKRFAASSSNVWQQNLRSWIQNLLEPLKQLAGILDEIKINPEPLNSLNGYAKRSDVGVYIIGVHAGLITIHNCLGTLQVALLHGNEKVKIEKINKIIISLKDYVRSGGTSSQSPTVPDGWFYESMLGARIARYMTTYVLAHELGHLALNHLNQQSRPSKEDNWNHEYEADEFGLELALNSPDCQDWKEGFLVSLGFWMEFVRSCESKDEEYQTHPPMELRLKKIRLILSRGLLNSGVRCF